MKPLKTISIAMVLMLFVFVLVNCDSALKGISKSPRLNRPRLAPLTESQMNEEQIRLVAPFKKNDGRIMNVFATFVRHPKLFANSNKFGWYVLFEQTLPHRDREILILRIGWLCRAKYEFGQHTRVGKSVGLTDEEILRITKGPDEPGWSTFDAALVRTVDDLYYDAIISDATWKTLSERYNESQLLDAIFTVGQYNLVSWALNSLGVQLDEGVSGFPAGSKR